jgi:hypothetical protein
LECDLVHFQRGTKFKEKVKFIFKLTQDRLGVLPFAFAAKGLGNMATGMNNEHIKSMASSWGEAVHHYNVSLILGTSYSFIAEDTFARHDLRVTLL